MYHASPARNHWFVAMIFAMPLAVLGFQVATWWGALAGALVGGMIATRLLSRGTADLPLADDSTLIVIPPAGDDTAEFDSRRVARMMQNFDRAVFEGAEISAKQPVLH